MKIASPEAIIAKAESDSQFSALKFPLDLGPNRIVMSFSDYSYTNLRSFSSARTKGTVTLPIPLQLQDNDDIDIKEEGLGTESVAALHAMSDTTALSGAVSGAKSIFQSLENTISGLSSAGLGGLGSQISNAAKYAAFVGRDKMDSITPGLGLVKDITTGTAVNPHTTLNFDGVSLKTFNFSWRFAPRNAKESAALRGIIENIRSNILPKYEGLQDQNTGNDAIDRAMLKYPSIVNFALQGVDSNYFPKFQPGMVTNFSTDYTPDGPVILAGGKPAIVNMSLTFKEAQIRTSDS